MSVYRGAGPPVRLRGRHRPLRRPAPARRRCSLRRVLQVDSRIQSAVHPRRARARRVLGRDHSDGRDLHGDQHAHRAAGRPAVRLPDVHRGGRHGCRSACDNSPVSPGSRSNGAKRRQTGPDPRPTGPARPGHRTDAARRPIITGDSPAASRANDSIRAQSPAATASSGVIQEPPTHATLGRARNSGAPARSIPPVGQNRKSGIGPESPLRYAVPPAGLAGKNFP